MRKTTNDGHQLWRVPDMAKYSQLLSQFNRVHRCHLQHVWCACACTTNSGLASYSQSKNPELCYQRYVKISIYEGVEQRLWQRAGLYVKILRNHAQNVQCFAKHHATSDFSQWVDTKALKDIRNNVRKIKRLSHILWYPKYVHSCTDQTYILNINNLQVNLTYTTAKFDCLDISCWRHLV